MPQTQHALLTEGLNSYPEALAAIREFRRIVVETVQTVVDDESSRLSRAMKVSLPSVSPRRRPDRLEKDEMGGPVTLGVAMRGTEWKHYCHVSWDKGHVTASCSITASDSRRAKLVHDALKKGRTVEPYRIGIEGSEVYLERDITVDDVQRFHDVLRTLLGEWARLWNAAGGLQQARAKGAGA